MASSSSTIRGLFNKFAQIWLAKVVKKMIGFKEETKEPGQLETLATKAKCVLQ